MEHADFLVPGLALIFDMDGVIVDSMPVHTLAWERYMESLGLPCEDIAVRMHGRRNDEIVAEFIGTHLPRRGGVPPWRGKRGAVPRPDPP